MVWFRGSLWKTNIPSKILIFGWRMVHNKIPMKVKLAKREVVIETHNLVCPLCFVDEDDVDHLFISYSIAKVWQGCVIDLEWY